MTSVPLNDPGAMKSIRLSQSYLGESVCTRLNRNVKNLPIKPFNDVIDLHVAVLIVTDDSTAGMLDICPESVIKFHDIVDD